MSKFGPYPESDFHCPIKGDVCEPYGLAVYGRWKDETENISLRAQLEQAKANSIIQEHIIKNGYDPADKDAIVRLTLENSTLRAALETERQRAEQVEAEAGALRKALEYLLKHREYEFRCKGCPIAESCDIYKESTDCHQEIARKALSPGAGAAFLEELRRLREESEVLNFIMEDLDKFRTDNEERYCPEWCACYEDNPCSFQLEFCARLKLFGQEATEKWVEYLDGAKEGTDE